jgi:hypothetical protein
VRGFTCAQLFTDGHRFFRLYPLVSKAEAHQVLTQFIQDIGIPKNILVDFAPEERLGEWGRIVKHYRIRLRTTEPKSPWQKSSGGWDWTVEEANMANSVHKHNANGILVLYQ